MIKTILRPMLSATGESQDKVIKYWPGRVLASPKLDGIRCLTHPSLGAVSRNFKPIPNHIIRSVLSPLDCEVPYLDGELVTFTDGVVDDFNTIQSKVMSRDTDLEEWRFMVFDYFHDPALPFMDRLEHASGKIRKKGYHYNLVEHTVLNYPLQFFAYAEDCLASGYEGAMYRAISGPYKEGRSTLSQGWLVKWKEFADAEGTVVGFQEKMHNANEQTKDAFGLVERSSHKENMQPTGTLGALVLKTQWGTLNVGTGFTDAQRQLIWDSQESYVGMKCTFKYQSFGTKDAPRFPVFKGWRKDL